ncbi:hypothetical protein [Amycolatopsis sp. NPDC003676]
MAEQMTPSGGTGALGTLAGALAGARFFLADGTSRTGGGSSGGGAPGFYLSKDAMAAELKNLQNLRTRIDSQIEKAVPMWTITPPGKDPASLRNTDASNNSGNYYRGHMMRQSAYLGSIIQKMKDALGIHDAHDQQAGRDIGQQGEGRF